MLRCVWQALNSLSIHVIYRDCPRGVPRGKQNVVRKRSFAHEYCLKPVTRHRYTAISRWRNQNFIMGVGRSRVVLGGGCAPSPEKMNFHQKMVGILVHSKMTFYVYAKIGQVNRGRPPPPGSATAIFQKWLNIDGYMLRGIWEALNSLSIHVTFTAMGPGA